MTRNEKQPGVPASLYIGTVAPGTAVEVGPVVDLSANQRAILDKQFQFLAERLGELKKLQEDVEQWRQLVEASSTVLEAQSEEIGKLRVRVAKLESRGQRCQKCGQYKNEPGICWSFDGPDGYPEPAGEHEWK